MVMATTPSPQQVGREFVRQYYTMLHDAPHMLHRFYSSGSTFIHGGVDRPGHIEEPLIGQVEINKKIQQLNYKDCHTKIRQVDSQATIGSAVVVQVTGELSNNGEPMRRFMQTFVLVPQTPKKYYVHNDIFRYQDEVYLDNSDTESEDQQNHDLASHVEYYQQQQIVVTPTQSAAPITQTVAENVSPVIQQEALPPRERAVRNEQQQPQETQVNGHQNAVPVQSETPTPTKLNGGNEEIVETVTTVQQVESKAAEEEHVKQEVQQTQEQPSQQQQPASQPEVVQQQQQQPQQAPQQPAQPAVPATWALIVNKNPTSTAPTPRALNNTNLNTHPTPVQQPQHQTTQQPAAKPQPPAAAATTTTTTTTAQKENRADNKPRSHNNEGFNGGSFNGRSHGPRGNGTNSARASVQREQRNNTNDSATNNEENARFTRHPDDQQVFVGNLHSEVTEAELLNLFSKYGSVIDVRINKSTKQQNDRRLPNYGFIIFENKESVDNLLNTVKTSLTYKDEKGNEHRLNIEEKRARQHGGSGGGGKQHRGNRSSSNGSKGGRLNEGRTGGGGVKRGGINNQPQQNHNSGGRRP